MRKLLLFLCLALLLLSCDPTKNQTVNTVQNESAEQAELLLIYNKADSLHKQSVINQELFDEFITKAIKFYDSHPENEITPDMLFKAGVACMILAKNEAIMPDPNTEIVDNYAHKGLNIFEKIQATYPDYEGLRNCYMNRAIIYDDILHQYLSAEYEFREFLHKYPDDSACENIRAYLQVLGKSDEEIMAAIEKK